MDARKITYRNQARGVIRALERRGMNGLYFDTSAPAVEAICAMIPRGSLVGLGGSETLQQSGLVEALRGMEIRLLDRYREGVSRDQVDQMRKEGLASDVYLASCNAVTSDGKLVNQDGFGNRVAAMIYGPSKVILVVGMNKVVRSLDDAISRIKTVAGPMDAVRLQRDTPCAKLGICNDPHCRPPQRICSQLVVIESSLFPGRITVVLVGEELGY